MSFIWSFIGPIRDNQLVQVALVALLVLILLDWLFGIGCACANHEFSSSKMREGISHKCAELGFVLVGIVSDGLIFAGLDIGISGPILMTIVTYLCIMEIGSLLEIFAKMNPALAESPVFKLLASVQGKIKEEQWDSTE